MFSRTKICKAALVALGSGFALASAPVLAQSSSERIEITGSRIKTLGAESPSPLQVLNAAEIEASGVVNLQDLLLKNPTMGAPTVSRTNSNFQTSSVGVSTVDLRNLGVDRTLVLVNGRRFVSGIPGSAAVDLNVIPTDFIERVDLLTGGASSTYGSDAVAGVVNIVLKRNFEGLIVDANVGMSEKKDDKRKKFSMTWGVNSANGKGNLMAHIGLSRMGAVYSKDRDFSAVDQISVGGGLTGDPAEVFDVQRPFYSSFAPQGRVFINPGTNTASRTFDKSGNVIAWSTNGPAGDGVGATGFNRSEFRSIAVPTDRAVLATKGDYNLAENHALFFEGTYAQTKTTAKLEPFPLDSANIYPDRGGRVAAEFLVNGALVRNPMVPDSIYNLLGSVKDADGARMYSFTRRLSEVGNRGASADRNTFRILGGARGTLLKSWDYELYAAFGSTSEAQTSTGQVNVNSFRYALEAIPDGKGGAMCRDATARNQGCVPISVFGYGSISPAALAYVTAPGSLTTRVTQRLVGGSISGETFNLPGGPVALAAGFEYRKEGSRSDFDALTQAGLNGGNKQPSTTGAFDVSEVYAEIRLPLLKNLPAVQSLSASAAVRASDYSTVNNTTSWNAGLEWVPVSDVKVRLTNAQSTRAPNISELYSPPQQTFPTGLTDPCIGVTASSSGQTAIDCRSDPGVAANIAQNGSFTLVQADTQGISGFNRGNPAVKQEKGKSFTLGLVFTPSMPALRGLTLTADYFNIKIDDAIVSTPRSFILQQCYGGDRSYCSFITRRAAPSGANSAGSISFIDSAVTNSGELATKGWDFTAAYSTKLGGGNFVGRMTYTRLQDGYLIPLKGSDKDYFAGEIGAARDRMGLNLAYKWGPFGVTSQTTYIGKSSLDDQFLIDLGVPRDSIKVGAKTYNDFQFSYEYQKVQFYLGIDNAFNTKPAPVISGLPGNDTGTETAAGVYDPIGRRYYLGVRASF